MSKGTLSRDQARKLALQNARQRLAKLSESERAAYRAQFTRAEEQANLIMAHGGYHLRRD